MADTQDPREGWTPTGTLGSGGIAAVAPSWLCMELTGEEITPNISSWDHKNPKPPPHCSPGRCHGGECCCSKKGKKSAFWCYHQQEAGNALQL